MMLPTWLGMLSLVALSVIVVLGAVVGAVFWWVWRLCEHCNRRGLAYLRFKDGGRDPRMLRCRYCGDQFYTKGSWSAKTYEKYKGRE